MKHLFLLAFFLPAFNLFSQNEFENLQFELLDTASNTGFATWRSNRQYLISPDKTIKHAGNHAIKLEPLPGKAFGAFMQSVDLQNIAPPAKINLSGWLKRDAVEGFAGLWFQVMAGDNSIGFDNMYSQQLKGSADWTFIQSTVIIDETPSNITFGGLLSGNGVVWFDDIAISIQPYQPKPLPDSLRSYLEEALTIMQNNALYRDSVDWAAVRASAMIQAGEAKSYVDCYPAISGALSKLGDHHSFLQSAIDAKKWQQVSESTETLPSCSGKMLDGQIAYITMPGFGSGDEKANTIFADQAQALIKELDAQQPKAWILDLRENTGGNCWPMLAGIGPLLGEGLCGYFVSPGQQPVAWAYKNGASYQGNQAITKTSRKGYRLKQKHPKLAVLTGPQTGSSGEVVTIAFRGRHNCRSFGQPTYGVSTGNENFTLRDGAQIFLTSSVYADRNMNQYGKKITPDETIRLDLALDAAKTWVKQ